MAYDYDRLYGKTPDALGDPTPVFVEFFDQQTEGTLRVLDVGCGQGRDALFIARLGHRVVGVDISPNGIRDLLVTARQEKLAVEGIATDITTFTPDGDFDVVLIDRTLHMLPEKERLEVLARLIQSVEKSGWVLISDERSNIQGFKGVLAADSRSWTIDLDARGHLFARCAGSPD